ncbi:hypothetical protein [Noviherbaspirillum malthae]|uniref:hypothetical protein n=1 Tax=Noviherbaspirillum malthae TaxID=1260987 RepID=UPI00189088C1|nr:hypothetical protein [Noviherbaspirillum malthae]
MEELTSTTRASTENAQRANQRASPATKVTVLGGEVAYILSSIIESSRKITAIISVIDGIAFRTDIACSSIGIGVKRTCEGGADGERMDVLFCALLAASSISPSPAAKWLCRPIKSIAITKYRA